MSPDPRPYLRPGVDLITAEDVRAWLRDESDSAPARNRRPPATVLYDTLARLTARLDRERRQACRRGALAMWRAYRASLGPGLDWEDVPAAWVHRQQERHRAAALAFRAAARAQ